MKRVLLAVLVVLGLASTATFGHAAALGVGAGSMTTVSSSDRCSTATTAATAGPVSGGTATSVVLTFPAACQGTTGRLRLVGASGPLSTADTSFTLPASGTTHTVTGVPAYTATAVVDVAMVLGGWGVPAQWSYTAPPAPLGPVVPGNAATVINSTSWSISNSNQACVTVEVVTNTAQNTWWRVDLVVTQAPFHGATSGYQIIDGQVSFINATAVNGRIGIQGSNNGWGNLNQWSNPRSFTVCHYNLPTPPNNPSAYTVSVTQGTWTNTEACLVTTVTGNGSSSFYVGWQSALNMAPAYQRIESTGRTVRRVQAGFSANIATISPAPTRAVSAYTLTTGWQGVVRLSETRSMTVCAYEY